MCSVWSVCLSNLKCQLLVILSMFLRQRYAQSLLRFCLIRLFFTQAMFTSYRIGLLRFAKLHSMMWTHFPFDIYVGYEFKNFEHYFNVFWWKKHPFEKKTREGTAIAITKECRKYEKLIWFWVMMKYSFSIHWLIQILVVIVVGQHY